MANWGIRVSKPGFDVGTCADYDLVMSSSFNMLKTKAVGTVGTAVGTIAHGLSYTPLFFSAPNNGTTGGIVGDIGVDHADGTNVYIDANSKYIIFYQTIV
jgi:hypothetical protein